MMPDHTNSPQSGSQYSASDEETEISRPNRWTDHPASWTKLTKQERGLSASLLELRNRDLSVHLYNAHALKRRARSFAEAKLNDVSSGLL